MFVLMPQWGQSGQRSVPLLTRSFNEPGLDSSLIQCDGASCKTAETPQKTPDFVESDVKGEAGVMSLGCLFDGLPHPAELLGGGIQEELAPGIETVCTDTQFGFQTRWVFDHVMSHPCW